MSLWNWARWHFTHSASDLESLVIQIIHGLGPNGDGVSIRKAVAAAIGWDISYGRLFRVLDQLEKQQRIGRSGRCYHTTAPLPHGWQGSCESDRCIHCGREPFDSVHKIGK